MEFAYLEGDGVQTDGTGRSMAMVPKDAKKKLFFTSSQARAREQVSILLQDLVKSLSNCASSAG